MIEYIVKLQTGLENNDNEVKFKRMLKADEAFSALWDIKVELRRIWKYEENMSDETFKKVEEIREYFFEILDDHDINLDRDYG